MLDNLYFTATVGPIRYDIHGYQLYVVHGDDVKRFSLMHTERTAVITALLNSEKIGCMTTFLREVSK
ncbi:MAG: hypothetical protein HGA33_05160 [Candidatus Moranbacteria bacterium]|nr:hypothetical protein [Candidatus Moranbacteria bacterium]NTW30643.1 hypothetical protein [Candidatus Moranbacteria bacterium]